MRKGPKIVQISGIQGIIVAIFVVACLCAGFVAFPGLVAMKVWNSFLPNYSLNLFQGIMLWAIIFLTIFISRRQHFSVMIGTPQQLNEEEMNLLMQRIRMQAEARRLNQIITKSIEEKIESEKNSIKENK